MNLDDFYPHLVQMLLLFLCLKYINLPHFFYKCVSCIRYIEISFFSCYDNTKRKTTQLCQKEGYNESSKILYG